MSNVSRIQKGTEERGEIEGRFETSTERQLCTVRRVGVLNRVREEEVPLCEKEENRVD